MKVSVWRVLGLLIAIEAGVGVVGSCGGTTGVHSRCASGDTKELRRFNDCGGGGGGVVAGCTL